MRIGILCSGGDSQGMNACVKAIVNTCVSHGIEPVGIKRGYQGLLESDFIILNNDIVENIQYLGGAILKVSRSAEFRTPEGLEKAVKILNKNKIDGVIVLGGNGSLTGMRNLKSKGVKCIGIPATIDNDLFYTERTLGFDTAVNNAIKAVDDIMQSVTSGVRGMVVRAMGRKCGDIALYVGVGCTAHSVATKELGTTIPDIINDLKKCKKQGVTCPLVVISENLDYSLKDVEDEIRKNLDIDTRSTELGYIQRGGTPTVYDRLIALQFGNLAVELLKDNIHGVAIGIKNNEVFYQDIDVALDEKQNFNFNLYKKLRDLRNI